MIIYDLCCDNDHRFEGWFRSADDFNEQLARQLIRCPQCESATVHRVPSAVMINSHGEAGQNPAREVTRDQSPAATTAMVTGGTQLAAMYRQLVRAIIDSSENVGREFASEARRIHYNEAPERAIIGEATADECEALRDEGIEIMSLPMPAKEDELN